jgi:exosome complex component CSL4
MQENQETVVPEINDTVTCKVIKVTPWYAKVKILCVAGRVMTSEVDGMIRVQDIRATEIDKVKIEESFRPGDVVLATVLSLGDSRSYYLSTAKNELGVVYARSITGSDMVPFSWKEMLCTKTQQKELRKVAKTF